MMSDHNEQHNLEIGRKLRAARQQQGLSLRDLAVRAEVSPSLLSQIENGKANPSVRSLHSIADALSVSVNQFFPQRHSQEAATSLSLSLTPSEYRRVEQVQSNGHDEVSNTMVASHALPGPIVRRPERPTIELEGGVNWSRLTANAEDGIEFLHITYDVGAKSGEKMSHHHGREFFLVLEGELLLELGFDRHILQEGDSITFDSETPHRLSNVGNLPLKAISVIYNKG